MKSLKMLILLGVVFTSGVLCVHFTWGHFGGKNVPVAEAAIPGSSKSIESIQQEERKRQEQQYQEKREQEQGLDKKKQRLLDQQQKRLQMIEEKSAQKRQQIEEFYLQKCRELQIRTEEEVRSLDSEEKTAWAEFNQKLKHIETTTNESAIAVGYVVPNNQNVNMGIVDRRVGEYAVGHIVAEKTSETKVVDNPAKEFASKQQQITETENRILTHYKQELAHFQRWRQFELDEIEKWEKLQKSYISNSIRDIKARPKSEIFGLVTSILYSEDNPSIILSNKTIMHEGDIIHGILVEKIYKDKVDFVKNEKRWTQKIREAPSSEWCN